MIRFAVRSLFASAVLTTVLAGDLSAQPQVAGSIEGPDGQPITAATVELLPTLPGVAQPAAVSISDKYGRFALSAPQDGVYRVRVAAPGRAPMQSDPLALVEPVGLPPVTLWEKAGDQAVAGVWGFIEPDGATPGPRPQSAEATAFSGQVRDADSGKPVAGALVWSHTDPGSFTRSGPDGRFQQRAPEPGAFWLEAAAPGYLPKRIQVSPVQIRAGRSLTLTLARARRIRGQVVDLQGGPVTGAWVHAGLEHPGERLPGSGIEPVTSEGSTGPDGSFELLRLRRGMGYTLRVQRPGFLPTTVTAVAPDRGSPQAPVRIILQPTPRAFGQVRDLQGRPVPGAEVKIAPAARPQGTVALRTTLSDESGRFSITELPSLEVDLEVRKSGLAPTAFRGLQLPANRPAVDLGSIVLRPGAKVRGRIVDRRGRPVASARIHEVEGASSDLDKLAEKLAAEEPLGRSSARGEFELTDRPTGSTIHLLILAEGYRPERLRGVRVPSAKPLVATLTEAFTVRGRALDEKGEPVEGAVVALSVQEIIPDISWRRFPAGKEIAKDGSTDREGRFALAGFPAGDAEISLRAPGFMPIVEKLVLPLEAPAAELTFMLARGTELAGRVTTTDGQPVAGARIAIGPAATRSDDDGLYQLAGLPPGEAEIELVHPHYPRQQQTQTLTTGANRLDFRLPAGQEVRGEVRDEEGKPVAGAWVRLRLPERAGQQREYGARSEHDGSFRLGPVADGRYLLRATATGYAETTSRTSVLVQGESVDGLEVTLSRGGSLAGQVVGLDKEELWRLRVEARSEDGRPYPAKLDTTGRYEIRSLPLGSWLIKATLGSGERQVQARAVLRHSGEAVERDLEFEERLRLTGRVLFLDEPLAEARVTLRAENRTVERDVLTDHQGGFELEDLEPDTYRIGVIHTRKLVVHNGRLALAEDRDIVIDLQGVTVRGTLADAATGKPLPKAMVSLVHQPGPDTAEFLVAGGTDETGAFTLPRVPPGRYRMRGQAEGYVPGEQSVEVPSQDELTGLEMALTPTPGLEIAVRQADGRIPPIVHFRAASAASSPDIAGTRVPDAEGRIRLPTPAEGSWLLWIGAPGCGTTKVIAQAPGPPVSAVLPPATRLSVQVPELATSDVSAEVTVLGPDGTALPVLNSGGILQQTWPTIGGKIVIEDLPAGILTVDARTGDGRHWSTTVVAAEASSVAVTLD